MNMHTHKHTNTHLKLSAFDHVEIIRDIALLDDGGAGGHLGTRHVVHDGCAWISSTHKKHGWI